MRENKASKAGKTLGERKRGENNYDNGNSCETVYLNERKCAGNYECQVTITQKIMLLWGATSPKQLKTKSTEMTNLKGNCQRQFDRDEAKVTKCSESRIWKRAPSLEAIMENNVYILRGE